MSINYNIVIYHRGRKIKQNVRETKNLVTRVLIHVSRILHLYSMWWPVGFKLKKKYIGFLSYQISNLKPIFSTTKLISLSSYLII